MNILLEVVKFADSNFKDLKRKLINHFIGEYGHINTLKIDNTNKTIFVSIKLQGDTTDTNIDIKKYKIKNMQIIMLLFIIIASVVIVAALTLKYILIFTFIAVVILLHNYLPVVFDTALEYWYLSLLLIAVYVLYQKQKNKK